ncbi:MAG: hypothetical protein ACN4G0_12580 [Polyangiales bacterium]
MFDRELLRRLGALCFLVALASCGDNGNGPAAANATSDLCPNVRGTEAILWDLYNGIPRTDTSVLPPPVPVDGGVYSHPALPLLGFVYPGGWTPTTTNTGSVSEVGVNLIRQDNQAIWRDQSHLVSGTPTARDLRDFEVQQLLQFLGQAGGQPDVVCLNEGSGDAGGGIIVSFSNVMIRVGNHTAVVDASVTPLPGLPSSSIKAKVVAAPTEEFPARAIDTFLAIDWQMLIGRSDNLFDRDGDGWLDGVDMHPDDPNRH